MTREEAIQILRTQYPHDAVIKEALGLLIPELRESEDERIRKGIVETIKQCPDTFLNPKNRDRMLAYLEKQKEQKPSEIDFEDWDTLGYIRDIVRKHVRRDEEFNVLDKWLTEHYVNQKPAEWSEEDEEMAMKIDCYLSSAIGVLEDKRQSIDNWLKSLRPSWKPSERQMKALEVAFRKDGDDEYRNIINSLYNDLKKL